MDPNTGSFLMVADQRIIRNREGLDEEIAEEKGTQTSTSTSTSMMEQQYQYRHPSMMKRIEWSCDILAFGNNVSDLITDIQNESKYYNTDTGTSSLNRFTLDYICMGKRKQQQQQQQQEKDMPNNIVDNDSNDEDDDNEYYTAKTLSYRVAQLLSPANAVINPKKALVNLLLIETPKRIYLGRKHETNNNDYYDPLFNKNENDLILRVDENQNNDVHVLNKWSKRPFQYSSAINPAVAMIVIDTIHDLIQEQREQQQHQHQHYYEVKKKKDNQNIKLEPIFMMDPTCGSGTFLAFALYKGIHVSGYDINDKCISGVKENLNYMFADQDDLLTRCCRLQIQDSTESFTSSTTTTTTTTSPIPTDTSSRS